MDTTTRLMMMITVWQMHLLNLTEGVHEFETLLEVGKHVGMVEMLESVIEDAQAVLGEEVGTYGPNGN